MTRPPLPDWRGPGPWFPPGWDHGRAAAVMRDAARRAAHRLARAVPRCTMSPTPDESGRPSPRRRLRHRLAGLMDTLARGASPPGIIDMFPPARVAPANGTAALLRRRLTMIARFGQTVGNNAKGWRLAGGALSLLLSAVALTGAAAAQDQQGPPANPSEPESGAVPRAQGESARFSRADAEKLWRDK